MRLAKEFDRDEIKYLYLIEFENFGEKFWKIGVSKNGVMERYRYKGISNMLYRAKVIFEIPMLAEDALLHEKWVKEKYIDYRYTPTREFGGSKTEVFSTMPTVTLDSRLLNDNLSFREDNPPLEKPLITKYLEVEPQEEEEEEGYYEIIEVDNNYDGGDIDLEENLEELGITIYRDDSFEECSYTTDTLSEETKALEEQKKVERIMKEEEVKKKKEDAKKKKTRDKVINNSMERRYLDKGMFVTSKELGKGEVLKIMEDDRYAIIYFKKVDAEILCDLQYRKGIYNNTETFKFHMYEKDMPEDIQEKRRIQRKEKEYWKKLSKRRGY